MEDKWICLQCQYLQTKEVEQQWKTTPYSGHFLIPNHYAYFCSKCMKFLRLVKTMCPHFQSIHQTKIKTGDGRMVKIDEIETEGERVDLSQLPKTAVLKAVKEEQQAPSSGKTGGLVITYQLKDGKTFPQKYSKISGTALVEALKKLEYDSTEPLFTDWHTYELTAMRTGFPRMIPTKKVK